MKRKIDYTQTQLFSAKDTCRLVFPFKGFEADEVKVTTLDDISNTITSTESESESTTTTTTTTTTILKHFCKPKDSIIGATYMIPVSSLPVNWSTQEWYTCLTLKPKTNACCPSIAPVLHTAKMIDNIIHLPRFYGYNYFGIPEKDIRSMGEAINENVEFMGTLCSTTPPQIQATTSVLQQLRDLGGAMLVLPCGFGKTVCSLWIAHRLGRRTLIVVHSEALADQWKQRIGVFLPEARIGRIQQDLVVVNGCDFVVCMIQSLVKREYDPHILSTFGVIILDEAHHVAAPMFSRALPKLPARYVLALSATPDRQDGLGPALEWLLGPIAFRAQRVFEHVDIRILTYTHGKQEEILNRRGDPMCSTMITNLSTDYVRTLWIVNIILRYVEEDRKIIVLSDRREQLSVIEKLVSEKAPELTISRVVGGTRAKDRDIGFNSTVLLSTYQYASEGIDIPRLDTLIMATPRSAIEQTLGRILRPHPEKKRPLVIDIKDPFSLFDGMSWKRHRYYKNQDYHIRFLSDNEDGYVPDNADVSFF